MLEILKAYKDKIRCKEETQDQDQEQVQGLARGEWEQEDQEAGQDQEQVLEEVACKIKEIFQIINKA